MIKRLLRKLARLTGPGGSTAAKRHVQAALGRDADGFTADQQVERARWRELLTESGEAARLAKLKDIHLGKRAFFIGNGPSIKGQDLTKLAGELTFVTNWFGNHEDYERIRPTYYCISSHEVFGGWNAETPTLNTDLRKVLVGREWASQFVFPLWARPTLLADPDFGGKPPYYMVFERPKAEISKRGTLNWDVFGNLDDGYTGIVTFCLPLAYHMGIREVYLLGCDCDYQIKTEQDPKAYFYDFSKHSTSTSKFQTLDRIWGPGGEIFRVYEIVRREAESRGMIIKNATAGGLLEVFERVPYERLV